MKNNKNDFYMIREVHEKFGSKVSDVPVLLTRDEVSTEHSLILSELSTKMKELSAQGLGGEVLARSAYIIEEIAEFLGAETIEDQVDALGDARYFIGGTSVMNGVDLDPIMKDINDSNLGKLWEDGKPRFDETGKWIKPPWWEKEFAPEPKIKKEIERQLKLGASRFN